MTIASHGRFVWYELSTTDVEAAKAFYTKVIGWEVRDALVSGSPYALFTAGSASVGGLMEMPEGVRRMGGRSSWLGYVCVEDIDATAKQIGGLGGAMHMPPMDVPNVSRFSIFADPQGARLALLKWRNPGQQRPADLGAPGHVGWHELLAADWEQALMFYGKIFGWKKAGADVGAMGTYQLFSTGGPAMGGMLNKPDEMPVPFWLFYFNVADIDAAAQRVKAGGGQILDGPVEVHGGSWVMQCADPQGAVFGLEGLRSRAPVGYFVRTGSTP